MPEPIVPVTPIADQAVTTESAPVQEQEKKEETQAVTTESAPVTTTSTTETQSTEEGSEPAVKLADETEAPEKKEDGVVEELKIVRKRAQAAEQENAYLRGQLDSTKKPSEPKPAATQTAPEETKIPDINDFDSHDDFTRAYDAYVSVKVREEMKVAEKLRKEEVKNEEEKTYQANVDRSFYNKVQKAMDKYPDYSSVVQAAQIELQPSVLNSIKESDIGPDIAYHLAKNIDEAQKIAQMSPLAGVREVVRLETKLEAAMTPIKTNKQVTQAPEPIKPTTGQSTATKKDYGTMSTDEFMKTRDSETYVKVGNRMIPKR